jgi:ribosomal-protein-alanine N-acetyltransferase
MNVRKAVDLKLKLRPMTDADLAEIELMEAEIFPDPWPTDGFEVHLDDPDGDGVVAIDGSQIVGYACYQCAEGEIHLTNLAVDLAHRRKSVAKELLGHILGLAGQLECKAVYLEVRSSNGGARQFYEAQGFITSDLSRDYYVSPREDALVMRRPIS